MGLKVTLTLAVAMTVVSEPLAAWGQQVASNAAGNFERNRNIAVKERPKPDYDAIGITLGSFRLFPSARVSATYTDNVLAAETNEESDLILSTGVEATLASLWANNALNARAFANHLSYQDFGDNDATDYGLGVDGRIDFMRDFALRVGVLAEQLNERRNDTPAALLTESPIEFSRTSGEFELFRTFNRLQVSASGRIETNDYDDARVVTGGFLEQDDRDRTVTVISGRVDYALSPDTAVFGVVSGNRRDFEMEPTTPTVTATRDSDGYEALVGVNFDVSRLVRGEVAVGYINQDYKAAGFSDTEGAALRGRVEWFPDELVTVIAEAERGVDDNGAAGAAGFLGTDAQLSVDYEFRRNFIVSGLVAISDDDYIGIDREDERWRAEASGELLLNREASGFVRLAHENQDSSGVNAGRNFDATSIEFGVRLRR